MYKIKRLDSTLKADKYALSPNMSLPEIVNNIVVGNTINNTVNVTIPEEVRNKRNCFITGQKGPCKRRKVHKSANSR